MTMMALTYITKALLTNTCDTAQAAYDHALDLPPVQSDLGFLRQCYVLASLCHCVYSFQQEDVGSTSNIELRLAGFLHDIASVPVKLLHFR